MTARETTKVQPSKAAEAATPATPAKSRTSRRSQFLTLTAKKRAEKAKRMENARKNLAILKEWGPQLKDIEFPPEDFNRQSYTIDPPERGARGAVGGPPCPIQVVLDRNLFYVTKARVPDVLAKYAAVP